MGWRIGPLAIGLHEPLHVREERLTASADACRLLYVSDVHLRPGRSGFLSRQIMEAAKSRDIDAVLLGGDLIDRPTELSHLRDLVRSLCALAPVFAVGGNHDRRVGMADVANAVVGGGGRWIHSEGARLSHGQRVVVVSGPAAGSLPAGDVHVLCAHHPALDARSKSGYDLVLAGHLHGCQAVAFAFRGHLYPGALFYRNCCLKRRWGASHLVVSRGVSDLIPIRWQCPREVVLCYV